MLPLYLFGRWLAFRLWRYSPLLGRWLWDAVYAHYRRSKTWKRKREYCLFLYHYRCAICPRRYRLEVHHLTYDRVFREAVYDLITLCFLCHAKEHRKTL